MRVRHPFPSPVCALMKPPVQPVFRQCWAVLALGSNLLLPCSLDLTCSPRPMLTAAVSSQHVTRHRLDCYTAVWSTICIVTATDRHTRVVIASTRCHGIHNGTRIIMNLNFVMLAHIRTRSPAASLFANSGLRSERATHPSRSAEASDPLSGQRLPFQAFHSAGLMEELSLGWFDL